MSYTHIAVALNHAYIYVLISHIYLCKRNMDICVNYEHRNKVNISNALYNVDDFTLSFDANGGTGKLNSVTHKGNQSYALPVNTFTRIGYEFRGWSFDKYTDTISYKNGATYDNRLISATLYAQWKKTGTGFIQRPFLDSDMFYKAISILGNNGTVYNKNSVDSRMAHIDTANNPGYFSLLK